MHPWEGKGLKLLKSVWQEVIIQVVNIQQYLPGQQKAAVSKICLPLTSALPILEGLEMTWGKPVGLHLVAYSVCYPTAKYLKEGCSSTLSCWLGAKSKSEPSVGSSKLLYKTFLGGLEQIQQNEREKHWHKWETVKKTRTAAVWIHHHRKRTIAGWHRGHRIMLSVLYTD